MSRDLHPELCLSIAAARRVAGVALILLLGTTPGRADMPTVIPAPTSVTTSGGTAQLSPQSRIICSDDQFIESAVVLREDLQYLRGLSANVVANVVARPGDIVLLRVPELAEEEYRLVAADTITVEAATVAGLLAGTSTLVQLIDTEGKNWIVPRVVIADKPFRDFRALMLDVKNLPHSPASIYSIIRACRFYKVRYLMLHTGEDQWIGAVMKSNEDSPNAFSPAQMNDYIAYGKRLGVHLIPHNESTASMLRLQRALSENLQPTHPFANYVDEIDNGGAYEFDGNPDERFWRFMEVVHHRALDQFAEGFPGRQLPFYHLGPCYGEGGMPSDQAARFINILTSRQRTLRVLLWDGVNAKDQHLAPHKDKLAICYYSGEFSSSKIHDYLQEGWNAVNSPFHPLYILGSGGQEPSAIYREWNMLTGGMNEKRVRFDLEPEWASQVIGGMLCTWDVSEENHFKFLRSRLPVFAEHAWNYRPLPYDEASWKSFERRMLKLDTQWDKLRRGPEDLQPPANAASWKVKPVALGNIVLMQAQPVADPSGVEYRFACIAGDGPSSAWQPNSFFVAEDLKPETQYQWRVELRDASLAHNRSQDSEPAAAITGDAFPTTKKLHLTFAGTIEHNERFIDAIGTARGYYENRARSAPFPWSIYFGGGGINTAGDWNRAVISESSALTSLHERPFSISLWINPLPSREPIVRQLFASSEKDGKRGGLKFLLMGDTLVLDTGVGGKGFQYRVSTRNKIIPGRWSHVVVTFNKHESDSFKAVFYVNGRSVGGPQFGPVGPSQGFDWNLNVFGDLGDVRVYEGVLSDLQIQFLGKPHPGFRKPQTP